MPLVVALSRLVTGVAADARVAIGSSSSSPHLHGLVLGEDPDIIGGGPGGVGDHVGHHQGDVSGLPRLETDTEGAGEGTGGGEGTRRDRGMGRGRGDRGRGQRMEQVMSECQFTPINHKKTDFSNTIVFTGWFPWRRPLPQG